MPKRGGLGRGLDALIPDRRTGDSRAASEKKEEKRGSSAADKANQEKAGQSDVKTAGKRSAASAEKTGKKKTSKSSGKTAVKTAEKTERPAKKSPAKKNYETDATKSADPAPETAAAAEQTAAEDRRISGGVSSDSPNGEKESAEILSESPSTEAAEGSVIQLDINQVEPNREQPRKYFDDEAIEELADSIRQFGIIQPLLVQKMDDYYQIIAGERRWRAAKRCGITEIPVIIRTFSSQEAVEVALIENIQREDLNPIEEAKAYQRLVTEYHLSQEEVAGRVSKSRSAVTNSMRLLKLSAALQEMVETGTLTEGHARAILALPSAEDQKKVADRVISEKLSVRQTEKLVKDLASPAKEKKKTGEQDELLTALSENLCSVLETKVNIRKSSRRRGKIEIEYRSDEEFDRIYSMLRSIK